VELYENNAGMKMEYQRSFHKVLKQFHAPVKYTLTSEA